MELTRAEGLVDCNRTIIENIDILLWWIKNATANSHLGLTLNEKGAYLILDLAVQERCNKEGWPRYAGK